jgi:hypothetical protein
MTIKQVGTSDGSTYLSKTGEIFSPAVSGKNLISRAADCSDNNISSEIQTSKRLIEQISSLETQISIAISYAKRIPQSSPNWQAQQNKVAELIKQAINLIPAVNNQLQIVKDLLDCGGLSAAHERILNELKERLGQELADLQGTADLQGRKKEKTPSLKSQPQNTFPAIIPKVINKAGRAVNAAGRALTPVGEAAGTLFKPAGEALKFFDNLGGGNH